MHRAISAALALAFSATCAGCQWTGGGFRADGPEMPRLRQALELAPGKVLADVGAGKGELTSALAREVGPKGRVFATELDAGRLHRLRQTVASDTVTVIEARPDETGLPPGCCDAIVVRRVYHHLTAPAALNASLFRSLRPGGVLAVIDFSPPFFWRRGSLGVAPQDVIREVTASGFENVRLEADWPGRGPLGSYLALFRKPR